MRTLRTITCLLCFAIAAGLARAEEAQVQVRELSLEQCIEIALENNLDIQIIRYDPRIGGYLLSGSYGAYEPVFSASAEHRYSLSPGGIDEEGRRFVGRETDSDILSAGVSGYLPWGMTYNLGGSMNDQEGNQPSIRSGTNILSYSTNFLFDTTTSNLVAVVNPVLNTIQGRSVFESASGTVGALTLRQPLLRDFWINQPRMQIYTLKKDLQRRELNFRDSVMTVITAVEREYFNLIYAAENVAVQEKAFELADRFLQENKKRVQVGSMAPLDEKQAESQRATSEADLLTARADLGTQQRVLKNLLSDSYTNEWANTVIVPTDKLLAVPQVFDLQESWRKGLSQGGARSLLQQQRVDLEVSRRQLRYDRNQLFPQLDVIGTYGYAGTADEMGGALQQIRNRENPFWSVGAQLSVPLGNISARKNLQISKAVQEQTKLMVKRAEQQTLIQIENDIGTARSFFERVEATRQARLYAEAALDAEQKKLENGKSTSFVVLQLQRDLTAARSAEIRALADYNNSLADLAYDEGTTLERRRVDLQDVRNQ